MKNLDAMNQPDGPIQRDGFGFSARAHTPTADGAGPRLAFLWQDLAEPVLAIVSRTHFLLDFAESEGAPTELVSDLQKTYHASKRLLEEIKGAPQALRAGCQHRDLDHRLRNGLGQVDGLSFLLMCQENAERFGSLLEDLQKIRDLCREFQQKLPRLYDPVQLDPNKPKPTPTAVPERLRAKPGKLLIVDDSPNGRELLRRFLEPQGHKIAEAENGSQALKMMRLQDYDLVLLDILMPRTDGVEVLRQLASRPNNPGTPIIVISGIEDTKSEIRCFELGADDYLVKPIDHLLLLARVNSCLQKSQLRLGELEQFFPTEVARQFLSKRDALEKGRSARVTVLFCDIRGFSRISERIGAAKTIEWISEVMERLSTCVIHHHGVVVDYTGDEIMAMWGAPQKQTDAAELACKAALAMLNELPELNKMFENQLGEPMVFGIGIHTGTAHVGNVGSKRRFKYGPLGSTVNLGSRVQGASKYFRSKVLITRATSGELPDGFHLRRLGRIRVFNINKPVEVHELTPSDLPHWSDLKKGYEKALRQFERQNFLAAVRLLGDVLKKHPHDGPSDLLLSRAVELRHNPPVQFEGLLLDLHSK